MEGIHMSGGIVAKVTRYHPGLIATISEVASLDGGASVKTLMLTLLSVCLLL